MGVEVAATAGPGGYRGWSGLTEAASPMRYGWLAAAGLLLSVSALAQQRPIQQQMPPLQKQWQDNGQAPVPELLPPSRPLTLMSPPAAPDMSPVVRPNTWLPAGAVRLQALDKVNAQATALTG